MSAALCRAQSDQGAVILETLQSSKMLIPKRHSFLKSIFAVQTPENESSHRLLAQLVQNRGKGWHMLHIKRYVQ